VKIIRTFYAHPNEFVAIANLQIEKGEFVASNQEGLLVCTPVNPLLAQRFFGFEVISQGQVAVAVKPVGVDGSQSDTYSYFNGEVWQECQEAYFHTIEQMLAGMSRWQGGIQFILKIFPNSSFREMSFGYEVHFEITEYLLNYAIPNFLAIPCRIAYTTRISATGKVQKPLGYELSKIVDITVQPMGKPAIPIQIIAGELKLPPEVDTNQVVQISFTISPFTYFARGLYQIEKLPCIVIRELPIRDVITPFRKNAIVVSPGKNEFDYPVTTFDLPLEILVMAQNMVDAKMIMRSLIEHVRDQGKIYIPPTDTSIGVFLAGMGESDALDFEGGMGIEETSKDMNAGVATARFNLSLKNLDY
jgi:hypothetical protein